ncbi:PEP-CTERM sorting domain-containing protein [Piscinibacter sp. XHJ-5]|uniref:PEP-CTERM sorting domain-containing protein n=1 Tax=Piscinibacter sp. XHJ-5 TaxID=3037797 RepID=UPI00245366F6|nr:PEP-CTERM sorting domain-containing protein [Piscinibacter sp. XHJ-5]
MDEDAFRATPAASASTARDVKKTSLLCRAAGYRPAIARGSRTSVGTRALPRVFLAAALAGASAFAQAGTFSCISGTSGDCALAASTLSWDWNGLDFTVFNAGSGYVAEVYFNLGSGMSASFLGGTGTVLFSEGAQPGALPGGNSAGFTSDASFDSDARGSTQYGINQGETATFRILGANMNSIDDGALAAGIHVRSLSTDAASLISSTSVMTPVPEPASFAMLLSGFGLVAWLTRSRRKS